MSSLIHLVLVVILAFPARGLAEDSPTKHTAECAARMAIIYEAVQAYRRAHGGEVPRRLTELCPRFLDNPGVLSCPRATASGRFTPANRELWTNARHEEFGSYNWEFSAGTRAESLGRRRGAGGLASR